MNSTGAVRIPPEDCRVHAARRAMLVRHVFFSALAARLLVVGFLCFAPQKLVKNLSADSSRYHTQGLLIAEEYARGEIDWSRWIDDGWFQFVGLLYFLAGPHLGLVMVVNAVLAAGAAVLVYRVAQELFEDDTVAYVSACVFALFPSLVYYTAMPLKEAASLFGLLSVVFGVVTVNHRRRARGLLWIACGLVILLGLRVYLAIVAAGCATICLIPMRILRGWSGALQVAGVMFALAAAAFFVADTCGLRTDRHESLRVFDLDYINHVRGALSRGNAGMFQNPDAAAFGQSWTNDLRLFAKGAFYFLFSIDPTNVTRQRQLAALPEMLFFLYSLPYLLAGVVAGWQRHPRRMLPALLFAAVIAGVYTSAATNMGALYRWRGQALPFVIILLVQGAVVRDRGILSAVVKRFRRRVTGSPRTRMPKNNLPGAKESARCLRRSLA